MTKPAVSYAFAKGNGVVVTALADGLAQVAVRAGAHAGALAEVRRALGVPLNARRIGADEFDELISALYNAADQGAAALADDLAQETFLQAYRSLRKFRGSSAFCTWLFGIAHNRWRNARRRQRTFAVGDEVPEPFVDSTAEASDWRHDLTLALRALNRDEQLALHLCYQQGLTHEEAAALLDWPIGTVKTHVARGKEKLRQLLAVWNPQT